MAEIQQAINALEKAREFVKSRKVPGYDGPCMDAHDNINKGIAALQEPLRAAAADAEKLCWSLRQFVRLVPAGKDTCWVRFKVGVQEFTVGSEPMPEDEAAHFAGLFVFALAGAFRTLPDGVAIPEGGQKNG